MQAEGQSVAGRVHLVDQRIESFAVVAQDVQNRAKDFTLDIGDGTDLDQCGSDEGAVAGFVGQRQRLHRMAPLAHGLDMGAERGLGLRADDGADIHVQPVGSANRQLPHRATQHGQGAIGDVVLEA